MAVPFAVAVLGCGEQPLEQPDGVAQHLLRAVGVVLGEQDPGQSHVFVLAQVRRLVVRGNAVPAGPLQRGGQVPVRRQHSGAQCRDRSHVRREVAHVHAFRLREQPERRAGIALGLPDQRHRHPPPAGVLRQAELLAELVTAP